MRKLYNEFFYIPKHGKVREKVMLTRVVMTVMIVIMCLAAMSFTAYAYFSHNVTSGLNTIKSANFETSVSIQITNTDGKAVDTPKPITTNYKLYTIADLEVGEWYTVTITPTERSTAKTGFIIVTATGCNEIYHTQQLGVDENVPGGKTPEIKFQLMITGTTDVVLEAHWGTSSYYPKFKDPDDDHYITYKDGQMEQVKLIVNGIVDPVVDSEIKENTPPATETTPPTTETTPPATETTPPATETTPPATESTPPTTETTPPATETTPPATETTPPTMETTPPATETTPPATETTPPTTETTPPATETIPPTTETIPPTTEATIPSTTVTTPPASTETSETTEPTATATTTPSEQTETVETHPQATAETQPTEGTTDAPTNETYE